MNSQPKRSGAIRIGLLALLAAPLIAALWVGMYFWVDRSSRELIYQKNAAAKGIDRLDTWAPWMFYPSGWSWLRAEGYRKLGDRARVNRLVDEMAASVLQVRVLPLRYQYQMRLRQMHHGWKYVNLHKQ